MKKSYYQRSTQECALSSLRPEILSAIKAFAEEHVIKDLVSQDTSCFVTTSEKKGLFGKIKVEYTGLVITNRWFIYGGNGKNGDAFARGILITDIVEITDYEKSEKFGIIEDYGIEIYGMIFGESRRMWWFIGLGIDPAGNKFRGILKDRVKR